MRKIHLAYIVALALTMGCSESTPTAPTPLAPPTLTGTWNGTYDSTSGESGEVRVTLSQSGSSVTGTWSASGNLGTGSGTVSGTVSGSSTSLTLETSDPTNCSLSVTATFTRTTITGTWATFECSVADGGSFRVSM